MEIGGLFALTSGGMGENKVGQLHQGVEVWGSKLHVHQGDGAWDGLQHVHGGACWGVEVCDFSKHRLLGFQLCYEG